MSKDEAIAAVLDKIKYGYELYLIQDFLKENNFDPSEYDSIINAADEKYFQEKLTYLPGRNKIRFAIYSVLAAAVFIVFMFVLPGMNINDGITMLSFIGSILFFFPFFYAMVYYKSWTTERLRIRDKPSLDLGLMLVLAFIPCAIMAFIFSWRFDSKADEILKATQLEAVGIVISGKSVKGNSINYAEITLEFETKEGKKVITTEDVSTYEFRNFYVGQTVNLVYAKGNERNIKLLTNDANIRNFKNTEERKILPKDLFYLMTVKPEKLKDELNNITYGWEFDPTINFWVNKRKDIAIAVDPKILAYVSNDFVEFPLLLERNGFKLVNDDSKKEPDEIKAGILKQMSDKVYRQGDLTVSIERINDDKNGFSGMSITTVIKMKSH